MGDATGCLRKQSGPRASHVRKIGADQISLSCISTRAISIRFTASVTYEIEWQREKRTRPQSCPLRSQCTFGRPIVFSRRSNSRPRHRISTANRRPSQTDSLCHGCGVQGARPYPQLHDMSTQSAVSRVGHAGIKTSKRWPIDLAQTSTPDHLGLFLIRVLCRGFLIRGPRHGIQHNLVIPSNPNTFVGIVLPSIGDVSAVVALTTRVQPLQNPARILLRAAVESPPLLTCGPE